MIQVAILCSELARIEHEKKQYRLFMESIKDLPLEEQSKRIKWRNEIQEEIRQEMKEERRHQELCSAIRDSRPRGFGIFF